MNDIWKTLKLLTLFLIIPMLSMAQGRFTYNSKSVPNAPRSLRLRTFNDYFGMRIGLAASSLRTSELGEYMPRLKGQTGLTVGAVYGISISDNQPAYFEVGLQYTEKGAKSNVWVVDRATHETESKYTYHYNLNYLELPFVFKYKYAIDDYTSVQPFLGGYVAAGIGGESYRDKSFSKRHFKTFDVGVRLGCGMAFTSVYVGLAYDIGLSNLSQVGDYNSYAKNNCLELCVGLDF